MSGREDRTRLYVRVEAGSGYMRDRCGIGSVRFPNCGSVTI